MRKNVSERGHCSLKQRVLEVSIHNQYTNKSDNKDDSNNDVEDIDQGDKLVNYFNNGNNYNDDDDDDNEEYDDDNDRDMGNVLVEWSGTNV